MTRHRVEWQLYQDVCDTLGNNAIEMNKITIHTIDNNKVQILSYIV